MQLQNGLRLSYYQELAAVNEHHNVKLVQHVDSGRFFVLKTLAIYDLRVFEYLAAHPVPGIPHIEELIEDDGLLYVVEEYISGTSLRDRIDQKGVLGEAEATELIRQLCHILRPLHQLQPPIVHRDIKPGNLIITAGQNLFLVDFNSAKESSTTQKQDTVLIGTVGYAAPEQYGFSASQPTTDIYALGVLLNEMLTGQLPNDQVYSGKLEPVIRKCLQMDPANRYQSVDELLRVLTSNNKQSGRIWPQVRAWLPPGLRNENPAFALASTLWYLFIIFISFTLEIKNTYGVELQLNRLTCFLIFLSETLWLSNYRHVWRFLPLTNNKNRVIKVAAIVLGGVVLLFGLFLILVMLTIALHQK